ncbi:hypothetical protein BD560DRAFT_432627 [Blakeslea trispora]|nr:hypothetical protein BD560DRAFT_432627 [Blakeslea trispora]
MSVPASSAQIPTGHAHSVNRSGGVIALSHSDFSPNTRKREVVRENGLDSGRKPLYIGSGKAASVFVLTPIKLEVEAEAPREEERAERGRERAERTSKKDL